MYKTRFRIITDKYNGYECQMKYWWFPFWIQMDCVNSCISIKEAELYIMNSLIKKERFIRKVVKEVSVS